LLSLFLKPAQRLRLDFGADNSGAPALLSGTVLGLIDTKSMTRPCAAMLGGKQPAAAFVIRRILSCFCRYTLPLAAAGRHPCGRDCRLLPPVSLVYAVHAHPEASLLNSRQRAGFCGLSSPAYPQRQAGERLASGMETGLKSGQSAESMPGFSPIGPAGVLIPILGRMRYKIFASGAQRLSVR
jgi:hypothetical protein